MVIKGHIIFLFSSQKGKKLLHYLLSSLFPLCFFKLQKMPEMPEFGQKLVAVSKSFLLKLSCEDQLIKSTNVVPLAAYTLVDHPYNIKTLTTYLKIMK